MLVEPVGWTARSSGSARTWAGSIESGVVGSPGGPAGLGRPRTGVLFSLDGARGGEGRPTTVPVLVIPAHSTFPHYADDHDRETENLLPQPASYPPTGPGSSLLHQTYEQGTDPWQRAPRGDSSRGSFAGRQRLLPHEVGVEADRARPTRQFETSFNPRNQLEVRLALAPTSANRATLPTSGHFAARRGRLTYCSWISRKGNMRKRVMIIFGTRPEAVKMAPLVKALETSAVLEPVVVSTGQHREMMDQVNHWFGITPSIDLNVFRHGSSLNELTASLMTSLDPVLQREKPDAVVIQGDTTTVAVAALACFHLLIPVVHLEAGLRSGDIYSPFPEELNRRIAGQVATLHLAPTERSRDNLLREGIDPSAIYVAGNTVIDALRWTSDQSVEFSDRRLREEAAAGRPMILLTTHRRENWGEPMRRVGKALSILAQKYPDYLIVFPAHANPKVREAVAPSVQGLDNVVVCDPLEYQEFVHAQKWARIVVTDSGGVQEEAPSLGKPVLVLRENTERPEAVAAGTARLVGTEVDRVVDEVSLLIQDPAAYETMSQAFNPYGDGRAAERSAAAIAEMLGVGRRISEFRHSAQDRS